VLVDKQANWILVGDIRVVLTTYRMTGWKRIYLDKGILRRAQAGYWKKAFSSTEEGTPTRGIISPYLLI
jgi:retron-type reverse transcriptase